MERGGQWQWQGNNNDDNEGTTMMTGWQQQWGATNNNNNQGTTTMTMTRGWQWWGWQGDDNDGDKKMTNGKGMTAGHHHRHQHQLHLGPLHNLPCQRRWGGQEMTSDEGRGPGNACLLGVFHSFISLLFSGPGDMHLLDSFFFCFLFLFLWAHPWSTPHLWAPAHRVVWVYN